VPSGTAPSSGAHPNKPRSSLASPKPASIAAPAAPAAAHPRKPAPVRDKTADDYGI
jgi:hypothetical protein